MRAAASGAAPWLAYAIVEQLAARAYFRILSHSLYRPPNWLFSVTVLILYGTIGALIGIAADRIFRRPGSAGRAATIALALIFSLGVLRDIVATSTTPNGLRFYSAALIGQMTFLGLLAVVAARKGLTGAGPWSTSIILVAPWFALMTFETIPRAARGALAGGSAVVAAVVAFVIARAMQSGSAPLRTFLSFAQRSAAVVACVLCACIVVVPQRVALFPRAIPAAEKGSPNIILITLDTVRADHTTVGGYERDTTPRLAAFAHDAWLFRNSYASSDNTLSTHASIFTGLLPSAHGANLTRKYPLGQPVSRDLHLLPEMLARRGYATAAVAANAAYLSRDFGFGRGFDYYDERYWNTPLPPSPAFSIASDVRELAALALPETGERLFRPGSEVTDESIAVAQRLAKDGHPFFLFVNYFDAHWPYLPPSAVASRFGTIEPWITTDEYSVLQQHGQPSPAQRIALINRYDAAIWSLDAEVGRFLDFLRASHLDENTLIIITADHGEGFGSRGYINHHASVYGDQVGVPLIIRFPQEAQGQEIAKPVTSVDLFATMLAAARVTVPKDAAGADLRRSLPDGRTVVVEHIDAHGGNCRGIIRDGRKLIVWEKGRQELYLLNADPGEHEDLATMLTAPDLVEVAENIARQAHRAHAPVAPAGNEQLLRSLGYLR